MDEKLFADDVFTPPTSPKMMELRTVSADSACRMNAMWHSRLPYIHPSNVLRNTHSICFEAFYGGTVWAVAIWSSPVAQNRFKHGKQMLELRRLAIRDGAPFNTATWMISRMEGYIKRYIPSICMLISYQDTEVHVGTIYKASNWTPSAISEGVSWTTDKRERNKEQTLAPKIRWERIIKPYTRLENADKTDKPKFTNIT
jgi:hypothetical protein